MYTFEIQPNLSNRCLFCAYYSGQHESSPPSVTHRGYLRQALELELALTPLNLSFNMGPSRVGLFKAAGISPKTTSAFRFSPLTRTRRAFAFLLSSARTSSDVVSCLARTLSFPTALAGPGGLLFNGCVVSRSSSGLKHPEWMSHVCQGRAQSQSHLLSGVAPWLKPQVSFMSRSFLWKRALKEDPKPPHSGQL